MNIYLPTPAPSIADHTRTAVKTVKPMVQRLAIKTLTKLIKASMSLTHALCRARIACGHVPPAKRQIIQRRKYAK